MRSRGPLLEFVVLALVMVAWLALLAGACGCGALRGGGPPPCRPTPSLVGQNSTPVGCR